MDKVYVVTMDMDYNKQQFDQVFSSKLKATKYVESMGCYSFKHRIHELSPL